MRLNIFQKRLIVPVVAVVFLVLFGVVPADGGELCSRHPVKGVTDHQLYAQMRNDNGHCVVDILRTHKWIQLVPENLETLKSFDPWWNNWGWNFGYHQRIKNLKQRPSGWAAEAWWDGNDVKALHVRPPVSLHKTIVGPKGACSKYTTSNMTCRPASKKDKKYGKNCSSFERNAIGVCAANAEQDYMVEIQICAQDGAM